MDQNAYMARLLANKLPENPQNMPAGAIQQNPYQGLNQPMGQAQQNMMAGAQPNSFMQMMNTPVPTRPMENY